MLRLAIAVALVCITLHAHATLVTEDWRNDGDGLVTLDTNTGLRWLSPSKTLAYHQDVREQLQETYAGWHFASTAEVIALYKSYVPGFTANNGYQTGVDAEIANDLRALHATLQWERTAWNPGVWSFMTCDHADGCDWISPEIRVAGRGTHHHLLYFGPDSGDAYTLFFNDDSFFQEQQILVRDTPVSAPEPASSVLFGLGVIGLWLRRRASGT